MKITEIRTVLNPAYPHLLHVDVRTDEGVTGLGESYHHPAAVAEYVHSVIAPRLLGQPATNIMAAWQRMGNFTDGFRPFAGTMSVEASATSAIDIALWDLRAKAFGVPLYEALGGAVRDNVRVYATATDIGGAHLPPPGTPKHERVNYEDWGIGGTANDERYNDWTASRERPGELARDLVSSGLTAMKIFPFTHLLQETHGLYITAGQLEEGLETIRAIRAAVGNRIDLAVDMGFFWTYAPALQIARALDEFNLMWIEDLTRTSSIAALGQIARQVRNPLAGFEFVTGLPAFIRLIDAGAISIVRMDLQYVGGLTEACRVASYAEAKGLGVVLHDCSGPVQWAAGVHCAVHLPNAMIHESVRPYYLVTYPTIIQRVPEVSDGVVAPIPGPGHGAVLCDSYLAGAQQKASRIVGGDVVSEAVTVPR